MRTEPAIAVPSAARITPRLMRSSCSTWRRLAVWSRSASASNTVQRDVNTTSTPPGASSERERRAEELALEEGLVPVPPYDDREKTANDSDETATGTVEISADVDGGQLNRVVFAAQTGNGKWQVLGSADHAPYKVTHTIGEDVPAGTAVMVYRPWASTGEPSRTVVVDATS